MRRLVVGAVFALCVLSSGAGRAQDMPAIRHTVRAGDTLELLAAEYYGDRQHQIFIMVANNMTHSGKLRKGQRLRIPMNRKISARPGDTLRSLAKQHMGDERRAPFLAEFNSLPGNASVAVGEEISIPFHVTHKAASKETISNIAAAYFGNKKQARLLAKYNFLSSDTLEAGAQLIIPINHVRVQAHKLPPADEESTARLAKRAAMQDKARSMLPKLQTAWRNGDFKSVKEDLIEIETEYLDTSLAVEVGLLLGSAHIAYGDDVLALAMFKKTLERQPDYSLSPYWYSPKIQEVWKRAGGAVQEQ
jgi:LysM repeat protein